MINGNNKVARQLIFSPATLTVALLLVVALLDSFLLPFRYLFVELHVNKNHTGFLQQTIQLVQVLRAASPTITAQLLIWCKVAEFHGPSACKILGYIAQDELQ